MVTFPKDFIWGTATSAHQIEGNNTNSDWWQWEQSKDASRKYPLETSGIACDSYNRYEEDFELCKNANNNAVRIGVEWARLQPSPDHFDTKEFDHYKKVLECARSKGLKTFVTLHHFTNPQWFVDIGGFTNFKSPTFFAEYAKTCAKELGSLVDVFLTINEPQVYALMSYTNGTWPPCSKNPIKALVVQINLMKAHNKAYNAIKKIVPSPVGIVKNIFWAQKSADSKNPADILLAKFLFWLNSSFFLDRVVKKSDLIGLNYYFTNQYKNLRTKNTDDFNSDMGWWIYPKGLYKILMELKKYNLPIYITENGVANALDDKREKFIKEMLTECLYAVEQGVDLKGYFYWSLLDNYEWHQGYWPKFGLVEIDRQRNLARKPRNSYYYYSKICASGTINV